MTRIARLESQAQTARKVFVLGRENLNEPLRIRAAKTLPASVTQQSII